MFQLIYHQKTGGRDSPKSVNYDYTKGLELLGRLAQLRLLIRSITVDSSVAQQLSPADRELVLVYPLSLEPNIEFTELRLNSSRAQKPIGRRSDVKPGSYGNSQKRIRITLESRDPSLMVSELADFLHKGA